MIDKAKADDILHELQDIAEKHPAAASELAAVIEKLAALLGV